MTTTDLRFTHYSGDTFMSWAKTKADLDLLTRSTAIRQWATLTEMGDPDKVAKVEAFLKDRAYQLVNPDAGDIAFLVDRDLPILATSSTIAVKARKGPASQGGHGPRYVSTFTTRINGEKVGVVGIHLVTAYATSDHSGRPSKARMRDQVTQADLMGQAMTRLGRGKAVAIGSGDLNGNLPNREDLQAVFTKHKLTTTAMETGDDTPTHGNARIDYAWTRDRDGRLAVVSQEVRRGPRWNTDHDPVDVHAVVTTN